MKRGVLIGKFLPFHNGHRHLIESARAAVDELTVLVCTLARESIPGTVRYEWLRDFYAYDSGIIVRHNPDENPQEPHEHPDFWQIWRQSILRFFDEGHRPQILFSSESYGDRLAETLGLHHVPIDPQRTTVPISGTRIREAPYRQRRYLPANVRPYFVKKIVITGPESAGKSTLTEQLARHYNVAHVHEYAREYLEQEEVHVDDLVAEHIPPIARGHAELEDRLTQTTDGLLLLDTDLIVTKIYAEHYFGSCPEWIQREARQRAARYDLQILLTPESPWIADQLRNRPQEREMFFELFKKELHDHNARYTILPLPAAGAPLAKRFANRLRQAIALIDAVLEEPLPDYQ